MALWGGVALAGRPRAGRAKPTDAVCLGSMRLWGVFGAGVDLQASQRAIARSLPAKGLNPRETHFA